MEGAEQVLLIILSGFLALFLLLGIIAAYKIIQILKALKSITDKAEHIADRAENLSDIFVKSSGPLAVGKLFTHIADTVFRKHDKRQNKGE